MRIFENVTLDIRGRSIIIMIIIYYVLYNNIRILLFTLILQYPYNIKPSSAEQRDAYTTVNICVVLKCGTV